MNPSQTKSPPKILISFQPAAAWVSIGVLLLVTMVGALLGLGSVLRIAFPIGSLLVGFFLYTRHPPLYIGFTWWLWFLTPILRRISDFHSQFDDQGVMLLAPYLVTALAGITFLNHLTKVSKQGTLPFVIAASAVSYGLFIGIINNPPIAVARTAVAWLTPIFFGFHLATLWRSYPQVRALLQRIFTWGVLIMGAYGIFQYMIAPDWDKAWLSNVEMVSFGKPEPQKIRVWSTMNSPVNFASSMLAGLMLLFTTADSLKMPASAVGYLSFLLSSVRAAWGGWIICVFSFMGSLKQEIQLRLMITVLIMSICIIPLTTIQPFSEVIGSRLGTFSRVQSDSSFSARAETYNQNLRIALYQGIGQGLGSTTAVNDSGQVLRIAFDSGILDLFFTLGWIGALPYLTGISLLILRLFSGLESRYDPFANACRAIVMSHICMLPLGSFMIDSPGIILWSFLGTGLAANKYFTASNHQFKRS